MIAFPRSLRGTAVLIFFFSTVTCAQVMTLQVRKEDSQIEFSIYKWGVFKEEGRFRDFDGTIEFDPSDLSATTVEFAVNTSSVDSRNEGRDRALRSEEFFNVTKYPTMRFKSVKAEGKGNQLRIRGDLTIRGVTKRLTIPVTVSGVQHAGGKLGTLVGFESSFTISRTDFHVADGWSIIDENATIHLLIGAGTRVTASH